MTACSPAAALIVDGGGSSNDMLMQFQSDLSGLPVRRPHAQDLSALGAAYMAGEAAGIWSGTYQAARLMMTSVLPWTQTKRSSCGWVGSGDPPCFWCYPEPATLVIVCRAIVRIPIDLSDLTRT